MSKDYGSWSLADLKSELRKRNAKLTGKKAVLVQRLNDYDSIFGPIVNEPETTYQIKTPEPNKFKDINSDSPVAPLSEEDLKVFCTLSGREDLATGLNMYNDGFLLTARAAKHDNDCFVMATCASEMRKQVAYQVIIKYEANIIKEAQCECAAGLGPFAQCKHAIVVLYALINFTKCKKIKIRPSCTSTLQNFHHPSKFYSGNPVEAQNLILKPNQSFNNIATWDPCPLQLMPDEKYVEFFKSEVVNFCCLNKVTMPIAQLIKPANKKAVYQDHDYLEKTIEQEYLENRILNENEIKKLEEETRTNKKMWKEERLFRLQSSNYGRICKSKIENRKKLAKSLLKNIDIVAPAVKHGLKFENKAVLEFTKLTGLHAEKCGIIVHPDLQFLASTPDRLIGEDAVLEVKCPFSVFNKNISAENLPYLYLCDKTGLLKLDESHEYFYQVQGQLFCTGRSKGYFCVYTIKDICIMTIDRDDVFISTMINKLTTFYNNFFQEQLLNKYLFNIKI